MLANYEKRIFKTKEDVWIKKFKNLSNILHWHIEPEIVFIADGTADIFINGKTYIAKKNQTFFIESGYVHFIKSYDSIIITCQAKYELFEKINKYSLASPVLENLYDIEKFYSKINNYSNNKGKFYSLSINAVVQEMIYNIFSNEKIIENNRNENIYIENIKSILEYINKNIEFVTFDDITSKFGFSKGYFSRLFKKLTGTNFSEYLNICKIQQSLSMIAKGDAKIIDIATTCGFNSNRHFDRVFKKITGFSPSKLPKNFILEKIINTYSDSFDPTSSLSVLIEN